MSEYHLLSTKGEIVLSNKVNDISNISDHGEEDSRMLLHLHHAVVDGHKKAFLRTVDSDVVVLSVPFFITLQYIGLTELWTGFGSGNAYREIPVYEVCLQFGPEKCTALPFFPAFMLGIGKKQDGMLG